MSIIFYGKEFKYSDKIPIIDENDIRVFSKDYTKKQMIEIMETHKLNIPETTKENIKAIFTEYSILKAFEDFGIITNMASK